MHTLSKTNNLMIIQNPRDNMRLIIKSPEYYGVAPNYINREISSEDEEEKILEVFLKFDENAEVLHRDKTEACKFKGRVKERYNELKGKPASKHSL